MKAFLLTADTIVQAILLMLCLIFPLTLFFAMPLGAWQMGSSLLKAIFLWSKLHFIYFIAAGAYCQLLIIAINHPELLNIWEHNIPDGFWLLGLAPAAVGAFWYFGRTIKDAKGNQSQIEWV
jgi:hypothetical protein